LALVAGEIERYREAIMHGHVGDRLVLEGVHVGTPRRVGIIVGLHHQDGTPPYDVRWLDTGRETLVYPGSEGHVEVAADHDQEGARA